MRKTHSLLAAAGMAFVLALATSLPARAAPPAQEILVTGFEPFDGDPVNPSWEAVRLLDGQVIEGYRIKCVRLPVDYQKVQGILDSLIPGDRPAAYVAFGEDADDQEVNLELNAVDHVDPDSADSSGHDETESHLRPDGAPVYHSTLPLDALDTLLSGAGVTVRRSTDAGSYVCDFTFYNARYLIEKNHLSTKMGFVHLPAVGQPWSVPELQQVGRDIVRVVAHSLRSPEPAALQLPPFDTSSDAAVSSDTVAAVSSSASPDAADTVASVTTEAALGFVGALGNGQ